MKMARKFIYVLLAALLSAMLLGGCGVASGYVGIWHCEAGDADF